MTTAHAPGKIILFGEHAVVYGRPAIAAPVFQVRAEATVEDIAGEKAHIQAPDIGREYDLERARPGDPIAEITRLTCSRIAVVPQGINIRVQSTIPVARGLGSGAAVSVAVARALARHYGRDLDDQAVSELAYEVEKLHHGTPSGIDNTTVAFRQPLYFIRERPPDFLRVGRPFLIGIADTGIKSPTKVAVGDVRRAWEADKAQYESWFDQVGDLVRQARSAIENGDVPALGPLMLRNQELASRIGVSSNEIDTLIQAAIRAGAEGAKLSGAGRGGNVIVLLREENRSAVEQTLREHGAKNVIVTQVQ